jgi:hypothetical protein
VVAFPTMYSSLRHFTLLVILFCLPFATLDAQTTASAWSSVKSLNPGTEVRISAGNRKVDGRIQSVTDDSITLDSSKGQEMFTQKEVSRAEVKGKGHRGRNALIGGAIGAAAGVAIGFGVSGCDCIVPRGAVVGAFAAAFGIGGALIGAFIPSGGWHTVYKQ